MGQPPKPTVTRLDYCQYLLGSQSNYTLTHFADHSEHFSHDAVNRYLAGDRIPPCVVWENVRTQVVGTEDGIVNLLRRLHSFFTVWHPRCMNTSTPTTFYKNHRFPAEIISHGVWLYFRSCLNRDRGKPHDFPPPTPPGIRVRTTAVRYS